MDTVVDIKFFLDSPGFSLVFRELRVTLFIAEVNDAAHKPTTRRHDARAGAGATGQQAFGHRSPRQRSTPGLGPFVVQRTNRTCRPKAAGPDGLFLVSYARAVGKPSRAPVRVPKTSGPVAANFDYQGRASSSQARTGARSFFLSRGGAVVAHRTHNPEVAGSIPAPASSQG